MTVRPSRSTSTHAVSRAVRKLARDGVVDLQKRSANLDYDTFAETEMQFQIALQGTATTEPVWSTVDVDFDFSFYNAPEMRDSPLTMPHFTYGSVIATDSNIGVFLEVQVLDWKIDDERDAFTGATLRIGVYVPGTGAIEFDGWLHVTFQGWGALDENNIEIADASDADPA